MGKVRLSATISLPSCEECTPDGCVIVAAYLDMISVEQHDEYRHAGDHGVQLHPDELAPGRFEPRLVRQEALLTNDAFSAKS